MKQYRLLISVIALSMILVACDRADTLDPLDPDLVSIDTMGLPYSGQANLVEATPIDDSGDQRLGLPEHIQINFGDSAEVQVDDPIIYIIPTEAYKQLWDEAGDTVVSEKIAMLEELLDKKPDPNTVRSPIMLPYEAYQVMISPHLLSFVQSEYLDWPWGSGLRYIGILLEDIRPILNREIVYIEQGLTNDGAYLVSFIYPPVSTSEVSDSRDKIPEEELQQANSNWKAYRQGKEDTLNSLSAADWDPGLDALDSVIGALQFGDYGN